MRPSWRPSRAELVEPASAQLLRDGHRTGRHPRGHRRPGGEVDRGRCGQPPAAWNVSPAATTGRSMRSAIRPMPHVAARGRRSRPGRRLVPKAGAGQTATGPRRLHHRDHQGHGRGERARAWRRLRDAIRPSPRGSRAAVLRGASHAPADRPAGGQVDRATEAACFVAPLRTGVRRWAPGSGWWQRAGSDRAPDQLWPRAFWSTTWRSWVTPVLKPASLRAR